MNYSIAGINVNINTNEEYFIDMLKDYKSCDDNFVMNIDIKVLDNINVINKPFIDRENIKVTKENDKISAYYFNNDKCYGAIRYNKDYEDCMLLLAKEPDYLGMKMTDIGYLLLGVLFNYRLTYFKGISLHGSSIKYNNEALIFTAPSGVGKSTQANLWKERYKNITFINDDKPALRIEEDKLICYGSPFSGKNHINVNDSAPIKAIINVVRGKENKIERLCKKDALVVLLEETTRSMLNQDINLNNFKIINDILALVPIYRLYCTPTYEAVDIAYKKIYEEI